MNPFRYEHSDPWSEDFVDVESLNSHVSNTVVACIEEARSKSIATKPPRSALLLVRGPAGSGKTHLFARLRRRCGQRATFVLLRPEIGVEPDLRLLLAKIVEALGRSAFGRSERQVDIVAGATLGLLRGQPSFPMATLDELYSRSDSEREAAIEEVLDEVERAHVDVSLNYLEQLLRVPFAKSAGRRAAMAWLSGNEPTEAQLRRLGLRSALPDSELMPALRTLALLSAVHGPLVLVFDQLENLFDSEDRADRINAYGNLVAELFDSVAGLVMVQMAVDSEWTRRIRPQLSLPQRSRLETRSLMLDLPTADERDELVRAWSNQLPEAERTPFPFSKEQLTAWRTQPGLTPRMLLIACRRILEGQPQLVAEGASESEPASTEAGGAKLQEAETPAERLDAQWEEALEEVRAGIVRMQNDELAVPAERIAAGLVCLGQLFGATPRLAKAPVNPSVRLSRKDTQLAIGVFQTRHAGAMGKILVKATTAAEKNPVLVVREFALAIPSTWKKVDSRRQDFVNSSHGSWLDLGKDDLTHLLGLHDFQALARSSDLSAHDGSVIPEAVALSWIEESLGWREWGITRCLLECLEGRRSPEAKKHVRPAPPSPAAKKESAARPAPVPKPKDDPAALKLLRSLHLASIERLTREARKKDAGQSRRTVMADLAAAGDRVVWLGQSLVCTREVVQ